MIFWAECYKTFYGCNLRVIVTSYGVVPGRPFQPSLMYAGKARLKYFLTTLRIETLVTEFWYSEYCYAERCCAECCYAVCCYAE